MRPNRRQRNIELLSNLLVVLSAKKKIKNLRLPIRQRQMSKQAFPLVFAEQPSIVQSWYRIFRKISCHHAYIDLQNEQIADGFSMRENIAISIRHFDYINLMTWKGESTGQLYKGHLHEAPDAAILTFVKKS